MPWVMGMKPTKRDDCLQEYQSSTSYVAWSFFTGVKGTFFRIYLWSKMSSETNRIENVSILWTKTHNSQGNMVSFCDYKVFS